MNIKNIIWNLFGLGSPLLVAALTVPNLISIIGIERFGFLALAWGLIGYAGILDLGIGRAVTQRISTLRGTERRMEIPDVCRTAIRITSGAGLIGFCLIVAFALMGGGDLITHTDVTAAELKLAIILMALAIPFQAVSATFKGINEAYLNFKGISLLRVALGVVNFGGPFLVALYIKDLYWLVSTLVVSRAVAFIFYRQMAVRCLSKNLGSSFGAYNSFQAKELFKFGGWVTISSLVNPFLVQADRFFIGFLVSASAVTMYVIPYEITVQSMILVGAITTVAFPSIAHLLGGDAGAANKLFNIWLFRVSLLMAVFMIFLAAFMSYILEMWVGDHVSEVSIDVGRVLCLGVFCNSIGAMFYSFMHAEGRARETAVLHTLELPVFIIILYLFVSYWGVLGAAVAWTLRTFVDAMLLGMMKYGR